MVYYNVLERRLIILPKPTIAENKYDEKQITMRTTLATRLNECRTESGLSHQKLAEKLRCEWNVFVQKQALINYEVDNEYHSRFHAGFGMNITYLWGFAKCFNVSADYLLGLADSPSPNMDVRAIHDKTRLSEEAIKALLGDSSIARPCDESIRFYEELICDESGRLLVAAITKYFELSSEYHDKCSSLCAHYYLFMSIESKRDVETLFRKFGFLSKYKGKMLDIDEQAAHRDSTSFEESLENSMKTISEAFDMLQSKADDISYELLEKQLEREDRADIEFTLGYGRDEIRGAFNNLPPEEAKERFIESCVSIAKNIEKDICEIEKKLDYHLFQAWKHLNDLISHSSRKYVHSNAKMADYDDEELTQARNYFRNLQAGESDNG